MEGKEGYDGLTRIVHDSKKADLATILRPEDVVPVQEVIDYLERQKLIVTIAGSATLGTKDYGDVDLLATGSQEDVTRVMQAYLHVSERKTVSDSTPPTRSQNGHEFTVTFLDKDVLYCITNVDYRFRVQVGETDIDLCLKATRPADSVDDEEDDHDGYKPTGIYADLP